MFFIMRLHCSYGLCIMYMYVDIQSVGCMLHMYVCSLQRRLTTQTLLRISAKCKSLNEGSVANS